MRVKPTGCGSFIVFMIIGAIIGSIVWPYTINTWLAFAGKSARIVWWQGSLIGFVPYIGHLGIPAAVITWILMMFIK